MKLVLHAADEPIVHSRALGVSLDRLIGLLLYEKVSQHGQPEVEGVAGDPFG